MREPARRGDTYLTLETGGGLFAIPISGVRAVAIAAQTVRPAVLPYMPDYVKCVAMVGADDQTQEPLSGKPIVMLEHPERTIGLIADSVNLIAIPKEGISADILTGAKTYKKGSSIFSIIDTKNLFKDTEYGA